MSNITSSQIRSARYGLKISVQTLSDWSGVSARTIKRMEAEVGVPKSTLPNLNAVQTALEAAGIEFIGTPDNGPGIRIHTKPDQNA